MVSIGCLLQTRVIEEVGGIGGGLLLALIPSSNPLFTLWSLWTTKKILFHGFYRIFESSRSRSRRSSSPLRHHDGRLEEVLQSNMNSQHL